VNADELWETQTLEIHVGDLAFIGSDEVLSKYESWISYKRIELQRSEALQAIQITRIVVMHMCGAQGWMSERFDLDGHQTIEEDTWTQTIDIHIVDGLVVGERDRDGFVIDLAADQNEGETASLR